MEIVSTSLLWRLEKSSLLIGFSRRSALYPEIEEGSQVTHDKVASAWRYRRK